MKKSSRMCFLLVFPTVLKNTGHSVCKSVVVRGAIHKKRQSMLFIFFDILVNVFILYGQ